MYPTKKFLFVIFTSVTSLTFSYSGLIQAQTTSSASVSSNQATTITTTTNSDQQTGNLVTSVSITEADLGVPKPTRWEFIKRRIARAFTFSQVKKLRLDNERAKLLLVQARVELQQGNTQKASELIDHYNKEMTKVVTEAATLAGQVSTQDNQPAQKLISQITEQKVLEASVLDSLSLKATGEFNRKMQDAKLKALRDLVKILDKENLSPEELHEKFDKISEKLEKKTTKAEEKFAKRLTLKEKLEEAGEDVPHNDDIDEALEEQEDETLDEIAKNHKENLGKIVREIEGNVNKHVLVLDELLKRLPDEARPAVQDAIERSQERLTDTLKKVKENQQKIEERIDEAIGEVKERKAEADKKAEEARKNAQERQRKALERLKERIADHEDQARLKKEIDKRIEKIQKDIKENIKREMEEAETSQSSTPAGIGISNDGATIPSSSGTGTSSTNGTGTSGTSSNVGPSNDRAKETEIREPKTYEVKYKAGRFDTSDLPSGGIAMNDSIKFKNDDDETIDIESTPHPIHTSFAGLNLGTLTKGQEKTVKFTKAGTYGFHNHPDPSITGSVAVK